MVVKWKQRFKPDVVLRKINAVRTVSASGGVSFVGFDLEECMPALESMLQFPDSAKEAGRSSLVWHAMAKVPGKLTPGAVLDEINAELSRRLATREIKYTLLTSLSVRPIDLSRTSVVSGATISTYLSDFPARYRARDEIINAHRLQMEATPAGYCRVAVRVSGKSPGAAAEKALDALDVQRAFWCLLHNPAMQFTFGSASSRPINVIRLGGQHTLHVATGASANESLWYEPGFERASVYAFKDRAAVARRTRWAVRRISMSPYGGRLKSSLIRYVRAYDDTDMSSAFFRLWGALESLVTPDLADYEKVVRRCAFIFKENDYHRQVLEHLRERRNEHVHAGESSDRARTHCLQLQRYFAHMIWFHLYHATFFRSLDEANSFLDSPVSAVQRARSLALAKRAIRFAG